MDGPYIKNLLAIIDRFHDSLDEAESDTESELTDYTSDEGYMKHETDEQSFTSIDRNQGTLAPSEYSCRYKRKGTVYLPPARIHRSDADRNTSYDLTIQGSLGRVDPAIHTRSHLTRTWSDPTGHTTSLSTTLHLPKPSRQ